MRQHQHTQICSRHRQQRLYLCHSPTERYTQPGDLEWRPAGRKALEQRARELGPQRLAHRRRAAGSRRDQGYCGSLSLRDSVMRRKYMLLLCGSSATSVLSSAKREALHGIARCRSAFQMTLIVFEKQATPLALWVCVSPE